MITISTKEELVEALLDDKIVKVVGPLAVEIADNYKKNQIKRGIKLVGGIVTFLGGFVSIFFTGGITRVLSDIGLAETSDKVAVISSDLAMMGGVALALQGLTKACNVKMGTDEDEFYVRVQRKQ